MHTRVHADMPACLRTMAPRRALGGLKRAVRVRVLRRCCAPVLHAAIVLSLALLGALAGLACGAESRASIAGAGAAGEGLPYVYTEWAMSPDVARRYAVAVRIPPRRPGGSRVCLNEQEFERVAYA